MPQTFQTGQKGEQQATAFLKELGYEILHINWRHKHLEIDIIAKNNDFLVIVEVKTRKNADFGAPETFVTKAKQRKIIRAANEFVAAPIWLFLPPTITESIAVAVIVFVRPPKIDAP